MKQAITSRSRKAKAPRPERSEDYKLGYQAGYQVGYRAGRLTRHHLTDGLPEGKRKAWTAAETPERTYSYMVNHIQKNGGHMFSSVRKRMDRGEISDDIILELLHRGWIAPHHDPEKGYILVEAATDLHRVTGEKG
jgi:hypothetical protein